MMRGSSTPARPWLALASGLVIVGALSMVPVRKETGAHPASTMSGVTWDHEKHARESGVSCRRCHHKCVPGDTGPSDCHECHYSPSRGNVSWKPKEGEPTPRTAAASSHSLCTGCHQAKAKGPTDCKGCHASPGTAGGCLRCHALQATAVSAGKHAGVACASCHGPSRLGRNLLHAGDHSARVPSDTCLFCHGSAPALGLEAGQAKTESLVPKPYSGCLAKRGIRTGAVREECSRCHQGHAPRSKPILYSGKPRPWCTAAGLPAGSQ